MLALHAHSTRTSPVLDEVSPPELGPSDVRIRVAAAAVNPVDVKVLTGPLRAVLGLPDPVGLGWDVSGTVTEVGSEVTRLGPGDRVAGLLHLLALKPSVGTHADETVLTADGVARIPDGLDLVEAASLPLNALAARQALALLGPAEGRSLLVTGGAGAVGGYALALATRAGWRVTALVRDADADFVARAGADPVTALPGPSFDAVLDAAVLLASALAAVRDGGSFVGVAPDAPVPAERRIAVHTLSVEPNSEALAGLLGLAAEGTLEIRVAGRVPLRQAAKAYDNVAAGSQRGRWLLVPERLAGESALGQAFVEAVEEDRPALLGALILLGREAPALLEEHLGAAVAEVGQHDDDQLVDVVLRPVGDREHEPLGSHDLAVLAPPPDLEALGARIHRQPPPTPGPDVHRNGRERHVGIAAAEPVGEALGLGPLLPQAVTRRVEHARDRDPSAEVVVGDRRLSHSRARAGAGRGGRSSPARSDGTPRASRLPARAAPPADATGATAPSGRV